MKRLVLLFLIWILAFPSYGICCERVIDEAKIFLGTPYRYGGTTLRGIDCSGFAKRVFESLDVSLPRTAKEQSNSGVRVERDDLEVGDLVFFKSQRGFHVGIYIGDGGFIHASKQKRKVVIDNLNDRFFRRSFIKGIRINFTSDCEPHEEVL